MANSMKCTFIIPCAKKDAKLLKRCLLSLIYQDYKNWNAVIAYDGHFKRPQVPQDDRFYFSNDLGTNVGAAAARNHGAKGQHGDIFWFVDADSWLMPGVLRLIMDEFKKDTQASFIYGGYRWNSKTLEAFPSRPYDPDLLTSMNYISTMSPMRRELFESLGGFDEDLAFFQDWDFFLRAAQMDAKGKYIGEVLFMTEEPDTKSISGNRKIPFRDRVIRIENKHGIPVRPIVVSSIAAPYQGIQRAKVLNARYIGVHPKSGLAQVPSQFDLGHRMVLMQGFFPLAAEAHSRAIHMPKGCLRVANWIGTDVWQLLNHFSTNQLKRFREEVLSSVDVHTCNSEVLRRELMEAGITAAVIPPPLCEIPPITPLPNKFTVSAYFTGENPMHCMDVVKDVARSMPDIKFILVGGPVETVEGNIHHLGWKHINEVVKQSSMHLRITKHDGWPMTPIQHLICGRPALTTFPLPFAEQLHLGLTEETYPTDKTTIIKKIRGIQKGKITVDGHAARSYYMALMDPVVYKKKVEKILEQGDAFSELDLLEFKEFDEKAESILRSASMAV